MDVKENPKKILYITYDGLTDPLGQSQILPYLIGLSKYGYSFTILSFEKKERFNKYNQQVQLQIKESNINWVYLLFTKKPPLLSKLYDAVRMRRKAFSLYKQTKFDMTHCRSYVAADVGLRLKNTFGVKFFFDMRGFWADEKKDGSWNMRNPIFKSVYKYYKRKETKYLKNADYIISLTEAGKKEMMKWTSYSNKVPIKVIPCCSDMNLFSLTDNKQKKLARKEIGLREDDLVLSYLGSIGTWYMLDEMLLFFKRVQLKYSSAKFLFLTPTNPVIIESAIARFKLNKMDFLIREATRFKVAEWIKASDINISFIKPVYSKISSSPTKLGEVLSEGIPVICNSGVGDVEAIVNNAEAGYVIHGFENEDFDKAIEQIPQLLEKNHQEIRDKIKSDYSLDSCIDKYLSCYNQLLAY